ncbi:hypothetical protein [Nocardia sp. CY41]|uniref:hypothetical protein n=1 Tax=Nocardia sp. CY41 TaxID=2608686 RepID=UPI0013596D9F|nr:hypothetical protein [Nocardia sp. CY41]
MTDVYAGSAEYTVPVTRTKKTKAALERVPVFGIDLRPRAALLPDRVRRAPIHTTTS